MFPWLTDFKEEGIEDLLIEIRNETANKMDDEAHHWLSQSVYDSLSSTEKFQKALDRYIKSRSKPWQIGRDYERYIGFLYEKQGYSVHYHGIVEGLNDLGRDLICKNKNETLIVQCKCWSKMKTIHEKHINQLFGTKVMYGIKNSSENVHAVFITPTSLSPTAMDFARALGIEVQDNISYDKQYPIIKCNIAKKDGTKIFHLPFD